MGNGGQGAVPPAARYAEITEQIVDLMLAQRKAMLEEAGEQFDADTAYLGLGRKNHIRALAECAMAQRIFSKWNKEELDLWREKDPILNEIITLRHSALAHVITSIEQDAKIGRFEMLAIGS